MTVGVVTKWVWEWVPSDCWSDYQVVLEWGPSDCWSDYQIGIGVGAK